MVERGIFRTPFGAYVVSGVFMGCPYWAEGKTRLKARIEASRLRADIFREKMGRRNAN